MNGRRFAAMLEVSRLIVADPGTFGRLVLELGTVRRFAR